MKTKHRDASQPHTDDPISGNPPREPKEVVGPDRPQMPSGLRPDLAEPGADGKGSDAGGVGNSI